MLSVFFRAVSRRVIPSARRVSARLAWQRAFREQESGIR
jgi:hypothetical protein